MAWIAQISDPHLRPRGEAYQGVMDSNAALAHAVEHLNRLSPRPDAVVLTGDVVDEGSPSEYAMACDVLARLELPLFVIPGNHDEREQFRVAFGAQGYLPEAGPLHYVAEIAGVSLIALDVTVPGDHHGQFDDEAEAWLSAALRGRLGQPKLVMMHQPPIVTGVPYLDAYRCFGATRLEAVIARYPEVRRMLCGHVHRMMMQSFGGTLLCTAPSLATSIALRVGEEAEPASYLEPPAFLLHHIPDSGAVVTHLVPVGQFPGPFDFA